MESILTSIKKLLGLSDDYVSFDMDIIMGINASLNVLTQLGVGPSTGFLIKDATSTWNDFLGTDKRLEIVKMYVYLKTRLLFDPPQNSSLTEVIKSQLNEYEWRISVQVDPGGN